jgi:hypothetical protein
LGCFLEYGHNLAGNSPVIQLIQGNSGIEKQRKADTY